MAQSALSRHCVPVCVVPSVTNNSPCKQSLAAWKRSACNCFGANEPNPSTSTRSCERDHASDLFPSTCEGDANRYHVTPHHRANLSMHNKRLSMSKVHKLVLVIYRSVTAAPVVARHSNGTQHPRATSAGCYGILNILNLFPILISGPWH
jgi:hypothetical protein